MSTSLTLSFLSAQEPQLEQVRFRSASGQVHVSHRGTVLGSWSGSGGTFSWTRAVRGLSILVLRTILHRHDHSIAPSLSGEQGSLAASLDYSIAKETQWLIEMFGVDGDGRASIRRLVDRVNPERRRAGPVTISFIAEILFGAELAVKVNDRDLASSDALVLLRALEGGAIEPSCTALSAPTRIDQRSPILVPHAAPVGADGEFLSIHLSDLVLEVLHIERTISYHALASKIREVFRLSISPTRIEQTVAALAYEGLCTVERDTIRHNPAVLKECSRLMKQLSDAGYAFGIPPVEQSPQSITYEFGNLGSMDELLAPVHDICLQQGSSSATTWWHLDHATWPLLRPHVECQRAEKFPTFSNTRYLCRGTTAIDAWVQRFYERMGVSGFLDSKSPLQGDFWIVGDLLVEHRIPERLRAGISDFLHSFDGIASFDNMELEKSYLNASERCSVAVHFAPGLARSMRAKLSELARSQKNCIAA